MAMNSGSKTRTVRQSRPGLEPLEARALLSGSQDPAALKQLAYTAPDGAHVVIHLFGAGNLNGSTVDPDGALNLRFSGTNQQTGIVAHVHGGSGEAPLRSLQSLNLPPGSLSGIGSTLLNVVNLQSFDLVAGGQINLTGGVHLLFLNSAASDTQINLRELPETSPTTTTNASGQTVVTLPTTASQNGQTLTYTVDSAQGQTLSNVSGIFVPGTNVTLQNIEPGAIHPQPGAPPAPPGVVISINHVNGPARDNALLGNPQVFGFDPTANALIRFDTVTGNPTLTIPNVLPNPATEAGVALARVSGSLVVLISDGSNVYAFNATSGAPVGQFSLANLKASTGMANPTRLGTFDTYTAVSDPTAGPGGLGEIQPIDVTRSLSTGQAQPLTNKAGNPVPPYALTRAFGLAGGLSGVPGLNTLYATGGAHFDPFQPNQFQLGFSSLSPSIPSASGPGGTLRETARTAATNANGSTIPSDSHGATPPAGGLGASLNNALGSIDQNLALFNGQTTNAAGNTVDNITLFNPVSFVKLGNITLNDLNPLTGLSGSFRPALAGSALVDVQGNTQSFRAQDAQGLVFSGEGNVNLVKIHNATDTTIFGYPFGHALIPHRTDVTIVSSTRTVGSRNGVTVIQGLKPTGPLSLP
jgi:hypothetical protein